MLRELVVEEVESESPVGTQEQYIDSYYEPGPDVPGNIGSYDAPGLHALCRCPHLASVRLFQLGETVIQPGGREEEYYNCHTSGELAYHLVKQMPNLEELYLLAHRVDANKIFPLPLPNLRILQLYHSNSYPLDKLAANKSLTSLTTLLCHPHALEYDDEGSGAYIRLPHLRAICRSPHLTNLTHLRLRLTDFGDAGAKEMVESGILKRLKVLDLQGGCITDEGAELLAECRRSEAPGIPQPQPQRADQDWRADDPGDSGEGGSLRSAWPNTGRRRGRHARVPVRGRHRVTPCTSRGTC